MFPRCRQWLQELLDGGLYRKVPDKKRLVNATGIMACNRIHHPVLCVIFPVASDMIHDGKQHGNEKTLCRKPGNGRTAVPAVSGFRYFSAPAVFPHDRRIVYIL